MVHLLIEPQNIANNLDECHISTILCFSQKEELFQLDRRTSIEKFENETR